MRSFLWNNTDNGGLDHDFSSQCHGGGFYIYSSNVEGINATSYPDSNIGANPLFANTTGVDLLPGTPDDDLSLQAGSPCIDAGNNDYISEVTDFIGIPRFLDDPYTPDTGNGDVPIVDMGAYEFRQSGVFFADVNLKAAVEEELAIQNPDQNDMLNLTYLDVRRMGITDLTGLEYAENLSTAYLYSNEITKIEPISGLPNLTYMHLAYNQIESLPDISSWTKIRYLYLYGNSISDITPLKSPKITTLINLYIYDNELLPIEAYRDYFPAIRANNPDLVNFRYDYGCEPMLAGDVNNDCIFNLTDFAILASDWLRCTHIYQDLCP